MYKLVDLSNLNWSPTHNGGISYGCYYKATQIVNGKKYYYKCSNLYAGQGVFGDESVYEVICSRLFRKLGINCIKCTLLLAKVKINDKIYTTYVCKSENYFIGYESRSTFENMHSLYGCTVNQLIDILGIQEEVKKMLIADFITIQRDRHGANIELLRRNGKVEVAPLFDNGNSLLSPYPSLMQTDISNFDILHDYPVNNYIGTRSLYQNLSLIDKPVVVNRLKKEDKQSIFYNLIGVLPDEYLDKIWNIIVYRYMFLRKRGVVNDREV
jgi:hypothetical protein